MAPFCKSTWLWLSVDCIVKTMSSAWFLYYTDKTPDNIINDLLFVPETRTDTASQQASHMQMWTKEANNKERELDLSKCSGAFFNWGSWECSHNLKLWDTVENTGQHYVAPWLKEDTPDKIMFETTKSLFKPN